MNKLSLLSVVLFITSSYAALQKPQMVRFQYPFSDASARPAVQYVDCRDIPGNYDYYCGERGWTITSLSESAIPVESYHSDLSDQQVYTNENLVRENIGKELAEHYKKTDSIIRKWIRGSLQNETDKMLEERVRHNLGIKDSLGRTCLLFAVCESDEGWVRALINGFMVGHKNTVFQVKDTTAQDHEGNDIFDLVYLREKFWKHTVLFDNKEVMKNIQAIRAFLIAALPFQYKAKFIKKPTALPQPVSQLIAELSGTEVDPQTAENNQRVQQAANVGCTDQCIIA